MMQIGGAGHVLGACAAMAHWLLTTCQECGQSLLSCCPARLACQAHWCNAGAVQTGRALSLSVCRQGPLTSSLLAAVRVVCTPPCGLSCRLNMSVGSLLPAANRQDDHQGSLQLNLWPEGPDAQPAGSSWGGEQPLRAGAAAPWPPPQAAAGPAMACQMYAASLKPLHGSCLHPAASPLLDLQRNVEDASRHGCQSEGKSPVYKDAELDTDAPSHAQLYDVDICCLGQTP